MAKVYLCFGLQPLEFFPTFLGSVVSDINVKIDRCIQRSWEGTIGSLIGFRFKGLAYGSCILFFMCKPLSRAGKISVVGNFDNLVQLLSKALEITSICVAFLAID